MKAQGDSRSGGRILVDPLQTQGVERLTCVPGESFLAVLDALHDASIDVLACRQEGGAVIMAEAYGKLTGRPGVCFIPRGPGSMNGSHGIHIAAQDSTPMIMLVGQVERGMLEREAFQELDYKAVFGSIAKWVGRSTARCDHTRAALRSDPEAAANRTGGVTSAFTSVVSTAIVKFEASAGPIELLANVAGLGFACLVSRYRPRIL